MLVRNDVLESTLVCLEAENAGDKTFSAKDTRTGPLTFVEGEENLC